MGTVVEDISRLVKDKLPEGFTFGYIGNVEDGVDDRSWCIFAPHPGRVGKAEDRYGRYPTDKLEGLLLDLMMGKVLLWAEAHVAREVI